MKIKALKAPKGFPKQVTLLGQRWQIFYVKNIPGNKGDPKDTNYLGMCYGSDNHVILVKIDQGRESMINTLWHEMLHAYFSMFKGMHDNVEPKKSGDDREEFLVEMISLIVIDVIRNVPEMKELMK